MRVVSSDTEPVRASELSSHLPALRSGDALDQQWRPIRFKLRAGEYEKVTEVCGAHGVRLVDRYRDQVLELASVRFPGSDRGEREAFAEEFVAVEGSEPSSGSWILLPWEGKLVHLLDEDGYFEVITSRNQNKITRAEQRLLRSRTIGVMGLSVGGEAAVTVAQEHLCGHIVLADFDRLDLSNLNRIGGGLDDLGVAKTTIAARRIGKINPYLKVTVFEEGVTKENLSAFLDGLDLLIEECDGMRAKLDVRLLARERRLDVVFAGDERGFLSVEPYGQHPDLPPFHGRIVEPQRARDEFATTGAFLRALTEWLGGWDQLSDRTRDSLERVGTSLCGYPQLASEARFAAGQIGHVARRLLLGEDLAPFLGHIDLEDLVPGAS